MLPPKLPVITYFGYFAVGQDVRHSITLDGDGAVLSQTEGWVPTAELLQALRSRPQLVSGTPAMPSQPRPDLHGIETTLPAFVEGRDRKVHFEANGAIVYEKEGWEPPRDVDGYVRDPGDPWRLLPLWPICALRLATGVRLANCGCVGVIMRCNDPRSPLFGQQVKYGQCAQCKTPEKTP
jgi:hypothetical protein